MAYVDAHNTKLATRRSKELFANNKELQERSKLLGWNSFAKLKSNLLEKDECQDRLGTKTDKSRNKSLSKTQRKSVNHVIKQDFLVKYQT